MIVGIILSIVVTPAVDFIQDLPGLSIPDYMPFWLNPSIDPMNTDMDILSPNYSLKGNYIVLGIAGIIALVFG